MPEFSITFFMNRQDFESVFLRHLDDVIRILSFYSRDKQAVEDWAHEVFMRLWEMRDKVDTTHPQLKGYILTIARHHALKSLQRNRIVSSDESAAQNIPSPGGAESAIIYQELQLAYQNALSGVGEKPRMAFLLSREQGMNYQQISDKMGISVKTVEAHISAVLKVLRARLSGHR